MAVTPEQKEKLMQAGQWPDFIVYRDNLKAAGCTPHVANKQSIAHFLGIEEAARKTRASKKPVASTAASVDIPAIPESLEAVGVPVDVASQMIATGRYVAAVKADFEGKTAGPAECVVWVARNVDILDVKPTDCPDSAAWSMLCMYRSSPAFRMEFWRQMYTKVIPSRSTLDDKPPDTKTDGAAIVSRIEALEAVAALAKSGGLT